VTPEFSLHLGSKLMHPLGSVEGERWLQLWRSPVPQTIGPMRVVQIGDLTHDLHLSIFPSLVSDRRYEPIINHTEIYRYKTVKVTFSPLKNSKW